MHHGRQIGYLTGLISLLFFFFCLSCAAVSGKTVPFTFPPLDDISIDQLQDLLEDGAFTSVDLVRVRSRNLTKATHLTSYRDIELTSHKAYVARTNEVNHILRAVSELNPDALDIARDLDAERAAGHLRGPLHGIPISIKDNIATLDKMNNTAGSYALVGARVSREAIIVSKLRDAGAIIINKASMGEWAQMRSRRASSSHGWSAYSGQVLGAYYPEMDPSGSSSGSAVSVAIGLAAASIGTETSGSIVNPAEKGNQVGLKPTLGLTSRHMVIPISMRQDSVGPMARTVKDAATILSVIAGQDRHDNWTSAQPFEHTPDYVKACKHDGLKGARVGIPRNGIDYFLDSKNAPIMHAFEDALRIISKAGARVIDEANFASFDFPAFSRNASIVLDTDFVSGLADYFSMLVENPHKVHNLRDVMSFTKTDPREEYPNRDTYVWDRELGRNISNHSPESHAAYQHNLRMANEEGVVGALDRYRLDALVMPTFTAFHLPAIAGLPVITVPLGFFPANTPVVMNAKGTMVIAGPNIPFGLSFVGRAWSEETLIKLAYAFEQQTRVRQRVRPYLRPKTEMQDVVGQVMGCLRTPMNETEAAHMRDAQSVLDDDLETGMQVEHKSLGAILGLRYIRNWAGGLVSNVVSRV